MCSLGLIGSADHITGMIDKENAVFGEPSPLQSNSMIKTPPRQTLGLKKRGALASLDNNSPGLRSASPGKKRQRRASSFNKRVSFGGQQIKVYNRHDEEWNTPSKKDEEFKPYDEAAEDTVTMPSLDSLLKEDAALVSPEGSNKEEVNTEKSGIFIDDDIVRAVGRNRLSNVFDTEDTETITLNGLSRQNSDLSEGDITRNIPSLADLVAGEEGEEKAKDGGNHNRRNSGLSDESDSFDRMYGKVFGDDATEDDLTNYTAATNATMTHNVTGSIPSIGALLAADEAEPETEGFEDENVTREIPSFSALIEEDMDDSVETADAIADKVQPVKPGPEEPVGVESKQEPSPLKSPEIPPSTAAHEEAPTANVTVREGITKKSKLEEKLKRLSEPIKLGRWSADVREMEACHLGKTLKTLTRVVREISNLILTIHLFHLIPVPSS